MGMKVDYFFSFLAPKVLFGALELHAGRLVVAVVADGAHFAV